ncbi:MAG TPA: superoxide dismutase [Bacteroidetes bacterium]|nr:superoxide dismutase [Bacteroidota bacterium]
MAFELPALPYAYDALAPHIDARTMEIHHSKHHAGYTNKLNAAIAGTELEKASIEAILAEGDKLPAGVRNNAGGFWNHSLFWEVMSPNGGGTPTGALADQINSDFGSFEEFQAKFNTAAGTRFGSGWAWLVKNADGSLAVTSSPNQDNPLMEAGAGTPILGLDVWEHAYYLNYQNRRPDYVQAWWNVVNWDKVAENFG